VLTGACPRDDVADFLRQVELSLLGLLQAPPPSTRGRAVILNIVPVQGPLDLLLGIRYNGDRV
jgi:hypothetical protein